MRISSPSWIWTRTTWTAPPWMGSVDFSGLKMKLIASIVAISAIYLLKSFMNIGKPGHPLDEAALMWAVIIHLTFIASGVLLALMDWIAAKTDKH
ncbi:YqhA family protein [Brevundimonas vancanneytii]|uniref:YqhA family protein n=1 Tax=Brevundimonas vancanneytii TaxID=1325724 RepID=UPI0033A7DFD6